MSTNKLTFAGNILNRGMLWIMLFSTVLGGVIPAHADSDNQSASYAVVFVSRKLSARGSVYFTSGGIMPGVSGYSRFQVAAPGKLMVREANGTLRTLIDGSNPTAASLNLIDVNAPDVSYDGTKIVFAGIVSGNYPTGPLVEPGAWRIYVINVDGTSLRQVTISDRNINLSQFGSNAFHFTTYDDTDPAWLPDGRIVFSSTRWPSLGMYGAVRTTNLHVVNADGTGMHRITGEHNGADRPIVDPLTGKIVYSRWWRNFRTATDNMATLSSSDGGFIMKDGLCAINHSGDDCEEVGGIFNLDRNAWHLAAINPDGTGLAQFAGRSNTFFVGEVANHAYGGDFAADGSFYANFFPMTNGTEAAGFGGIRRFQRGPNGYTHIIGVTTRDESVQQFAGPNSYGVYVGNYAADPAVQPDGKLVISWARDTAQDYGLYLINSDGSNRTLIYDNPGTTELRARIIRSRPVPPVISDRVTTVASLLPPNAQGPYEIDGTFTFQAMNVYFNAPVDANIISAPSVGSANTIRFFLDHQRSQQRGSFETLDFPILLKEVLINPDGSVTADLPANLPLFEQIRTSQANGYRVPLTSGVGLLGESTGAAHVAGLNFGRPGIVARCVGCHAGHTMIAVPENPADALWTNLATGAQVTISSKDPSLDNGDGLIDRHVKLDLLYSNHKRYWYSQPGQNAASQWAKLTFPVPVTVRTVRLWDIPSTQSGINVLEATVRLYSDAAGTVEVANARSGALSENGTNVAFPDVLTRVVRVEINAVNGSTAGLAEIEVIARAESSDAVGVPTPTGTLTTETPTLTPTATEISATAASPTPTGVSLPTSTPVAVDTNTKALLHMDGNDASTNFIDQTGKIWTTHGNAQIDTAQSKFGGASGRFDGSGDYLTTPSMSDFDFASGDFTVDFWVRFNSLPTGSTVAELITKRQANNNYSPFAVALDGINLYFLASTSGSSWNVLISGPRGLSTGTWYHLAFVRSGNTWKAYKDGTQFGSTATVSGLVMANSINVVMGATNDGNNTLNGWMDEVRFSKGIARWTTNFTPPSSPYGSAAAPTNTPVATSTLTSTAVVVNTTTATPTATSTPVTVWTSTFTPTGTSAPATETAAASPTSTSASSWTETPASSPTSVFTPTNTSVPTWTPTNTAASTLTHTPTNTLTATVTSSPTNTPTVTSSPTTTSTVTPSITPSSTRTPLPTNTKTSTPSGIPSTSILDTFNRANGRPGANWGGANSGYRIVTNQLDVRNGGAILWKKNSFGKDQQVFVTLTKVDTQGKEIDLLLKAQSPTNWGEGVIEVLYDAVGHRVQVLTYTFAQDWVQCGADIPVTFVDGDQFGARAKANGMVEVYRNGALIGTCDASGWSYSANGGYIGLWFIDAGGAVVDDFGGGTIAP